MTANPSAQPVEAGDAPAPDLRATAKQAAAWTGIEMLLAQGMRLGGNLVLTRLLLPEAFGIMAIVQVLLIGLNLFSDVGIGPSIVQNKRGDDPVFLRTAFSIQAMRGAALWLIACAAAWPMAVFYDQPILAQLIPVAGLSSLVLGFMSTRLYTARRHMQLKPLVLQNLVAQVIGLIVMAVWAYLTGSVWALVIGGVLTAGLRVVLSHVLLPGERDGFRWDRDALQALVKFGKWVFIATVLTFLSQQADRMILGKLLPWNVLGVYTIAFFLTDAPRQLLKRLGKQVLFPVASRKAESDRQALRQKMMKARWKAMAVMGVVVGVLVCGGDYIVTLLWDTRYEDAAWMVPILGLGIWVTALFNTLGPALMGLGKPSYNALGGLGRVLWIVVAIWPAYQSAGLLGVVVVMAMADLLNYASVVIGARREGILMVRQDVICTALFLLAVSAVIGLRLVLGLGLPFDANVPRI